MWRENGKNEHFLGKILRGVLFRHLSANAHFSWFSQRIESKRLGMTTF